MIQYAVSLHNYSSKNYSLSQKLHFHFSYPREKPQHFLLFFPNNYFLHNSTKQLLLFLHQLYNCTILPVNCVNTAHNCLYNLMIIFPFLLHFGQYNIVCIVALFFTLQSVISRLHYNILAILIGLSQKISLA